MAEIGQVQAESEPEDRMDAAVIYRLCPVDPEGQRLELTMRIPDPDPQGVTISLPAWTPGSYMVRDFARHVLSIQAGTEGAPVSIRKLDKSTWAIGPADSEITVQVEIHAGDLSVRAAYLDTDFGFVNGTSVFFRVHGRESRLHRLHVLPPPCSLPERISTSPASASRSTGCGRRARRSCPAASAENRRSSFDPR